MSGSTADQKAETKGKREDDSEVEVILGDGFSIVDDVKEETSKNVKEEKASPAKKMEADPEKATGNSTDKKEKVTKEKESVKEAESAKKGDGKKDNPAKIAQDSKTTGKGDSGKAETDQSKEEEKKEDKSTSDAKAEKTSPSKSEDKSLTESKDDSLLITAEDDIEESENSEGKKTKTKTTPVVNGNSSKKPRGPPSMWVSNIARRIKATDLKRVFSKHGKVVTAKIVTNGKSYFGYVSMDSMKSIERCIKYLNHTRLGDKKISISSERPDAPKKKPVEAKKAEAAPNATKKESKDDTSKEAKAKPKKEEEKKPEEGGALIEKDPLTLSVDTSKTEASPRKDKPLRKRIEAPKKDETLMLKREISRLKMDLDRMRRRLEDEQARSKTYLMRARRFQNTCKDLEEKSRTDKKAFDREREILIKKNRVEQIKIEAERDLLEKDRIDLRRRRDDLDRDIRKFNDMQRAAVVERSHRSSRKSRSLSPPPRNSSSSGVKRLKTSEIKHDTKKARWSGDRTRTPPPPPKLSPARETRSSKRDHDHFYDDRSARREAPVYVPSGGYHESREPRESREGRHRPSFAPETKSAIVVPPRSGWANSSLPTDWRSSGTELPPQYNERFRSEAYRAPPSGYSGQSRSDVPVYSSSSRVSDPEYRRPVHYESAPRKY